MPVYVKFTEWRFSCLQTNDINGNKSWDLHFWLGAETSQVSARCDEVDEGVLTVPWFKGADIIVQTLVNNK